MDAYLDALEKEIDYTAAKFYHKHLNSIYIGGGTPTTLEPYQLDRLIRKIKCSFDLSDCLEFTVEAGRPDSITREKLEVLRKWGIHQSADHAAENARPDRKAPFGRTDCGKF